MNYNQNSKNQEALVGRPTYLISIQLSKIGRLAESIQNKYKDCWNQSSLNQKWKPNESLVNDKRKTDQLRLSDREITSHHKSNEGMKFESEVKSLPSRPHRSIMESAHASLGQGNKKVLDIYSLVMTFQCLGNIQLIFLEKLWCFFIFPQSKTIF